MSKIKSFISKISGSLKETLKKYPVTLATIVIVTLFLAIFITKDLDIISQVIIFGVAFSVTTFFVESLFNKKLFKIIGYIISAIIGLIFSFIMFNTQIDNSTIDNTVRIFIGYIAILIMMALYVILKKEKLTFSEYVLKVLASIFSITIIYGILSIGILLLTLIFIELILSDSFGNSLITTQILLLGLFYIPGIVISISNVNSKEVNVFIKALVKYVLLPLISVGILIIYIYMIKILALGEMPSNVIFRILAIMFVFAFPTWTMIDNFKKEAKIIKIATKLLPYLYMPFIILEIISLGMRIGQLGITPIRCLGIGIIIIQIIALLLSVLKEKKYLSQILIYLSIAIFILFITPLNYNNISLFSQKTILTKYIKEDTNIDDLEHEYKMKAVSAYRYLKNNNGEKYIPEYIESVKDKLANVGYYSVSDKVSNMEYIYFYEDNNYIDVRNYSTMIKVNQRGSSSSTVIKFDDYNGNYIIKADIKDKVNEFININNEGIQDVNGYIEMNRIIKLDENKDLYLTKLSLQYYKSNNEPILVAVSGYILQR